MSRTACSPRARSIVCFRGTTTRIADYSPLGGASVWEGKPIPPTFDYHAIPQLRHEAKEKFHTIKPTSLGQASRISGISPADLAVLLLYLEAPARMTSSASNSEPEA